MTKTVVLEIASMQARAGIEMLLMNMLRNFDHEAVQMNFLYSNQKEGPFDQEILSYGGEIFRILPTGPSLKKISAHRKGLLKVLREHPEITTVHIHGNTAVGCLAARTARKAGIPQVIVHSHNDTCGNLRGKILHIVSKRMIRGQMTRSFCCSDAAGAWMFGKGTNYTVFQNAIPLEKYRYSVEIAQQVRAEFGLENCKVIGHVGRMTQQKNHVFILKVFQKVYMEHPEARLLLIGDGKLREELGQTCKNLGISQAVIPLRESDCVERMMQAMDVFLFPSIWEGLGIVLVEAQAAGLPCVVSDIIQNEVRVTELVEALSLKEPLEKWAEYVWRLANQFYDRTSNSYIEKLCNAGYDISEVAAFLQKTYESAVT